MELRVTAGVDWTWRTPYVFAKSGEQCVLDPWPVRPFLSLGATGHDALALLLALFALGCDSGRHTLGWESTLGA